MGRNTDFRHSTWVCCLHDLLEALFFLSFQFGKELVEVLLVLNGLLFLRDLGFGQCHGGADGETQNRSYIGASLFCLDSLLPFFGIFAVILDQPTSRCQTTQTSTDSAADATDVVTRSFLILLSSAEVTASIDLRLLRRVSEISEECFSLALPSC